MRGGREEAEGASRADHTRLFPGLSSVHSATSPWELEVGHSGYVYTPTVKPGLSPNTQTQTHQGCPLTHTYTRTYTPGELIYQLTLHLTHPALVPSPPQA